MRLFLRVLQSILVYLVASPAYAALEVSASVNQNPVIVGQAFTLEVVAQGSLDVSQFDASSLLRAGFVVGSTSTSRNFENINGVSRQETRWVTTLLVREPGDYMIPALQVAGTETKPFQLEAIAMQTLAEDDPAVQMQINVETETAYVGQSFRYQMRLLVADQLEQANILAPRALGANIERLGEDERSTEVIQGRRYRILSRYWLITPQQPGTISITSPHLSGVARTQNNAVVAVELEEDPFEIDVKGIPDNFEGTWLPSSDVAISESIEPEQLNIAAGEGFVRQISITIAGLGKNQLPNLSIDYGEDFRVYPQAPIDSTYVKDGVILSKRVQRVTLIPNKAGSLKLPAVTLPWWNTRNDQRELAQVDARIINVSEPLQLTISNEEQADIQQPQVDVLAQNGNSSWAWFFATAWITTMLAWLAWVLYKRKTSHANNVESIDNNIATELEDQSEVTPKAQMQQAPIELFVDSDAKTYETKLSEKQLWKAFERSCDTKEPRQMLQNLDIWLSHHKQAHEHMFATRESLQAMIWGEGADQIDTDTNAILSTAQKQREAFLNWEKPISSLPPLNGKIDLGKKKDA